VELALDLSGFAVLEEKLRGWCASTPGVPREYRVSTPVSTPVSTLEYPFAVLEEKLRGLCSRSSLRSAAGRSAATCAV
jgi:hypothetical protein